MKYYHYYQHLRNEEVKGTKEYQLKQCMDILGCIAKAKNRMALIMETCQYAYGLSPDGKIQGSNEDVAALAFKRRVIQRLENYYNNKVRGIGDFQPNPVKLRNKNLEYYCKSRIYTHKTVSYSCKFVGFYNKIPTYEVVYSHPNSGFKVGDQFTPNEPEKYFDITKTFIN